MPTTTVNASLRYWPGSVAGQTRSGYYKNQLYNGRMSFDFSSVGNLKNIDITSITLSFTVGSLGGAYTKYLYLCYNSTVINVNPVGAYSFTGCRNANKSITFSASSNANGFGILKSYIESISDSTQTAVILGTASPTTSRGSASGKDYDYDYMNITAATLSITYSYKKSSGKISNTTTGSQPTLTITAYNQNYTHKATWKVGNWTNTSTSAAKATAIKPTTAIPHSALPNSTSGTGTVTLETLNNGTSLGSNTYNFTVTVPSSVVPEISSTAFKATPKFNTSQNSERQISSTAAGWGQFIQGYSWAELSLTASVGSTGATLKTYTVTAGNGASIRSGGSGNITSGTAVTTVTDWLGTSGNISFTAKVTDSRGRTASRTITITVRDYTAPRFTSVPTAYRCDNNGNRDETDGTYAMLTANFTYSSVNSNNSLTTKNVVLNGTTTNLTSGTATKIGAGALTVDNTYNAVITLKDTVGITTKYTVAIPSAAYIIHIAKGGKAVGIGQAASGTNKLGVKWTTEFGSQVRSIGGDFYRQVNSIDVTELDNGITENTYPRYRVSDKAGKDLARLGAWVLTDGRIGVGLSVLNYVNDTYTERSALVGYLSKTGEISYSLGSASAFRTALGLNGGLNSININSNYISSSDVDSTAADNGISSNSVFRAYRCFDTNDKVLGQFYTYILNNGMIGTYMEAFNYDTNGNQVGDTWFGLRSDKSGNVSYSISHPAPLRSALGVGVTAMGSISSRSFARGGTEVTVTWNRTMPNTSYSVSGSKIGPNANGFTEVDWTVSAKTTTGITVYVYNSYSAAVTIGIDFIAVANT